MAKVEDVLAGFGAAIVTAQSRIVQAAREAPASLDGLQTAFSISETELELKLVFAEQGGATAITPVSAGAGRMQDIDPGVVSTLRAKILVVPDESPAATRKAPGQVRDEVLKRPDVLRLAKILGDLAVTASYLDPVRGWIVDVVEPGGRLLRRLQIDD